MSIFKVFKKSTALLLALVMLLGVMTVAASAEYEVALTEEVETEPLPDSDPEGEPLDDEQPDDEPQDDGQTNEDPPDSEPPEDDSLELSESAMSSDNPDITADFTDPVFLAEVRKQIGKATGPIYKSDVEGITGFRGDEMNISSLAGIEHFTALEDLSVRNNQITSLDVSNNIALEWLDVCFNQLTTLDVSNNIALWFFGVSDNNLTTLNLSNNTALWNLHAYNNQLTTIVLGNKPALECLYVDNNKLTTLDVSGCTALEDFRVNDNNLTTLDVSKNTTLDYLVVDRNQLTTLDVSNNPVLDRFRAYDNELTSVRLSPVAPYSSIYLVWNRMVDTSAITGRSDIVWDSGNFSFSPQKSEPNSNISLSRTGTYSFTSRPLGYGDQEPLTVTITNTSDEATGDLTIALSGTNASSFTISPTSLSSIDWDDSATFTVVPKTGLPIGTYTAKITVSGENITSKSFDVSFTVTKSEGPAAPTEVLTLASRTTSRVTLNPISGDVEYARSLTNRAPTVGWQNSVVFEGLRPNTTYYFFARFKETDTHFASAAGEALAISTSAIPVSISITPAFSMVSRAESNKTVELTLNMSDDVEPDRIQWSYLSAVFEEDAASLDGMKKITLTVAAGAPIRSHIVSVAVTVAGIVYRANAEVNVMEENPTFQRAKLADNTAVINRAKNDAHRSVEVPIVLNYIPDIADRTVSLFRVYSPGKPELMDELTAPGGPLTAKLNDTNTAIVIDYNKDVLKSNRNFKGITVIIGSDSDSYSSSTVFVDGTLDISVINRFPQKLTAIADQLDLFYGNDTGITLMDSDGAVYEVEKIELRSRSALGKISVDEKRVELLPENKKTGTIPVRVTVKPGEYDTLKANGSNQHDVNIRVVNNTPALRLSSSTVTLHDDRDPNNRGFTDAAMIRLLTRNAKIPFESFYEIKDIESVQRKGNAGAKDIIVDVDYTIRDGFAEIYISPEGETAQAGRTNLEISFWGSEKTVVLPLTIKTFNPKNLKPTVSIKTVTVNTDHAVGSDIVTIPIKLNAANLALTDWRVIRVGNRTGGIAGSDLDGHIEFDVDDNNMITFSVKAGANLNNLLSGNSTKRTIPVRIGSNELMRMNGIKDQGKQRSVTVNLVIVKSDVSFTVSQKGRIDIANPQSFIDATIKLNNTSERIEDIWLRDQKMSGGMQIKPDDVPSKFFDVELTGANTFRITAKDNVVPRFRHGLGIEIKLEGRTETIKSWSEIPGTDRVTYKPNFNITPIQTTSKAWRSADNVTLRAARPHTGDDIRLNLTTPANVKLGHVNIQQVSLDALNFVDEDGTRIPNPLVIEQNGANNWTIRFRDGIIPWGTRTNTATTTTPLKSSYNIRLELWAEGTYEVDSDGNPVLENGIPKALVNGKATSKPTLVTIKVNIRP